MLSTIGTKGVARGMKKICCGTRRDEGTIWFTELSDKGIRPVYMYVSLC